MNSNDKLAAISAVAVCAVLIIMALSGVLAGQDQRSNLWACSTTVSPDKTFVASKQEPAELKQSGFDCQLIGVVLIDQ